MSMYITIQFLFSLSVRLVLTMSSDRNDDSIEILVMYIWHYPHSESFHDSHDPYRARACAQACAYAYTRTHERARGTGIPGTTASCAMSLGSHVNPSTSPVQSPVPSQATSPEPCCNPIQSNPVQASPSQSKPVQVRDSASCAAIRYAWTAGCA